MTIDELIERLEWYRDDMGGDTEVRLVTQQSWPFENSVEGLCSAQDIADYCDEDEDEDEDEETEPEKVLFIVEGQQLGYGTKKAWEVCE